MIKWECDSSCSPCQRHCLSGKLLILWSHDSRGGNNELIVYSNIEYRAIRVIFGPTGYYSAWVWPWNRFERLFAVWTFKKSEMNFLIEDILILISIFSCASIIVKVKRFIILWLGHTMELRLITQTLGRHKQGSQQGFLSIIFPFSTLTEIIFISWYLIFIFRLNIVLHDCIRQMKVSWKLRNGNKKFQATMFKALLEFY